MDGLSRPFEIVCVEDCGSDNSWEVLCDLKANNSSIRGIRLANNFGQWAALLCGLEKARGNYVVTIDDDLQYDEQDIAKLAEHLFSNELLLVYGIPQALYESKIGSTTRNFRNYIVNLILDKEITSSFRIFRRDLFVNKDGQLRSRSHFEAAEKQFIAKKYKDRISVNFRARKQGKSGYSILAKIRLLLVYGLEYFTATSLTLSILGITTIFLSMLMFALFLVRRNTILHDSSYHLLTASIFNLGAILVSLGVISYFLSQSYVLQKGKPVFVIAEEI